VIALSKLDDALECQHGELFRYCESFFGQCQRTSQNFRGILRDLKREILLRSIHYLGGDSILLRSKYYFFVVGTGRTVRCSNLAS
jgi:hypothetical protein